MFIFMFCVYVQRVQRSLVEDINAPELLGIAVAVRSLALNKSLQSSKVLLVKLDVLEVGDDARLGDGLRDD